MLKYPTECGRGCKNKSASPSPSNERWLISYVADLWNCSRLSPSGGHIAGVRAVGHIAMELMQKYAKDDGVIGVENLDRWPLGSKAVDFLSQTTSAQSYGNLLDVRFLPDSLLG